MSEKQPEEAENTIFERDKTAKGPEVQAPDPSKIKVPLKKPRKVFVPKKVKYKSDKPMEYRVRHIRVSSTEAAQLFRQSILDFQKELADQPTDDPDKEFEDRTKVENFFARVAKKYSTCPSKGLGGELGWISKNMETQDDRIDQQLIDAVMETEKFVIPEPVKTTLGVHIILNCESRIDKSAEKKSQEPAMDPRYEAMMARPDAQAPTRKDIPT